MRSLPLLALLCTLTSSCRLFRSSEQPERIVVSPRAFEFAGSSTADIVDSLPPGEAIEILTELDRVTVPPGTLPLGQKQILAHAVPDGRAPDAAEVFVRQDRLNPDDRTQEILLPARPRHEALREGFYFSTVTAVAVEEGLDPTAIPALLLGYRPDLDGTRFPTWLRQSGLGVDLLVGGALGGIGGGESEGGDVELALGLGISVPWSDSGAFSIGVVTWRAESLDAVSGSVDEDTQVALYLGVSLGSFNVGKRKQ